MHPKSRCAGPGVIFVVLALGLALPPSSGATRAVEQPGKGDKKTPPKTGQEQANWKSLFDGKSLVGWKATDFGGEGEVEVKGGAVVMDRGNDMTGITYARGDFPRSDYEVSLEGKRVAGNDFFSTP